MRTFHEKVGAVRNHPTTKRPYFRRCYLGQRSAVGGRRPSRRSTSEYGSSVQRLPAPPVKEARSIRRPTILRQKPFMTSSGSSTWPRALATKRPLVFHTPSLYTAKVWHGAFPVSSD